MCRADGNPITVLVVNDAAVLAEISVDDVTLRELEHRRRRRWIIGGLSGPARSDPM